MKITKRQLRRIIKEASADYADERPNNPMERAYAKKEQDDDSEVNEDGDALYVMADDIVTQTKTGRISAETPDGSPDGEIYFDLGDGEGITVKVLRRGK